MSTLGPKSVRTQQEIPSRLYRFQPCEPRALEALENRAVWFSRPSDFNDILDCSFRIDVIEQPTREEYLELLKRMAKKDPDPSGCVRYFTRGGVVTKAFEETVLRTAKQYFAFKFREMRWIYGICCFTESYASPLMWAHYAQKSRGFCIEYDSAAEIFAFAEKVAYSDTLPKINPARLLLERKREDIVRLFTTKSTEWAYEKEWRVFHHENRTTVEVSSDSITRVLLGPKMGGDEKRRISRAFAGLPTRVVEMRISASGYEYVPADREAATV